MRETPTRAVAPPPGVPGVSSTSGGHRVHVVGEGLGTAAAIGSRLRRQHVRLRGAGARAARACSHRAVAVRPVRLRLERAQRRIRVRLGCCGRSELAGDALRRAGNPSAPRSRVTRWAGRPLLCSRLAIRAGREARPRRCALSAGADEIPLVFRGLRTPVVGELMLGLVADTSPPGFSAAYYERARPRGTASPEPGGAPRLVRDPNRRAEMSAAYPRIARADPDPARHRRRGTCLLCGDGQALRHPPGPRREARRGGHFLLRTRRTRSCARSTRSWPNDAHRAPAAAPLAPVGSRALRGAERRPARDAALSSDAVRAPRATRSRSGSRRTSPSTAFGVVGRQVPDLAPFIGFVGLSVPRFEASFTPCVEVGLEDCARTHWGGGYAPEAARAALAFGFETLRAARDLSFTTVVNGPSRRVMEKLGHEPRPVGRLRPPALPEGHALRRHVLYRITPVIRKLPNGCYRLYSRKPNPKTGKRRNLGTFKTRAAAGKHEQAVQYFKRARLARLTCRPMVGIHRPEVGNMPDTKTIEAFAALVEAGGVPGRDRALLRARRRDVREPDCAAGRTRWAAPGASSATLAAVQSIKGQRARPILCDGDQVAIHWRFEVIPRATPARSEGRPADLARRADRRGALLLRSEAAGLAVLQRLEPRLAPEPRQLVVDRDPVRARVEETMQLRGAVDRPVDGAERDVDLIRWWAALSQNSGCRSACRASGCRAPRT